MYYAGETERLADGAESDRHRPPKHLPPAISPPANGFRPYANFYLANLIIYNIYCMKKKYFATLLLLATATAAGAQSYDYLTFRDAAGNEHSLPAEGLKITFDAGRLKAVGATAEADFDLSQLREMYFSTEPVTGIAAATADDVRVSIVGGRLRVTAPAGSRVSVYSADGRKASAESLSHGVYFVKVNDKTYKVLAQ